MGLTFTITSTVDRSKQDEIKNIIDKSGVPYTSIVQREENYGVGRNLIGARRDLFDVHGYERVILIEDDLIPCAKFCSNHAFSC